LPLPLNDMPVTPRPPFTSAIVVIPYLAGLRGAVSLARMVPKTRPMPTPAALGLRWWAPPGMRCTKFFVPGMPVLTRGSRCTKFFVPGVPVAMNFGEAITLRGFLGFVVPVVV